MNRFTELLTLLETAPRSFEMSGTRRETIIDALRIAADHVALPDIDHATTNEKMIVGKLVSDLLAAGYSLSVWNGGDTAEIERSEDPAVIYKALGASDTDELVVYKTGRRIGWIRLIWSNDVDVISDYTTNLEKLMGAANKLAQSLS